MAVTGRTMMVIASMVVFVGRCLSVGHEIDFNGLPGNGNGG